MRAASPRDAAQTAAEDGKVAYCTRTGGDARAHVLVPQERGEEEQRYGHRQHHAHYSQQQHILVSL